MPKENKRFINPLLRPSQDQPQQDSPAAPTIDVAPTREKQETVHDQVASLSPAAEPPESDVFSYPSDNAHAAREVQVVNETPSEPVVRTRVANPRLPESDTDRATRPATPVGRSASRSATGRSSNGRNAAREDTVHETGPVNERDEVDEDRSQGYRRRVEVRFEHMHERLTVWIDRDLKRGLEDLASRRNLSKTALINEAMADLLKKHNVD